MRARYDGAVRRWLSLSCLLVGAAGCDGELRFSVLPDATNADSLVSDASPEVATDATSEVAPQTCKADGGACPYATQVCDPSSGACVLCFEDAQCKSDGLRRCDRVRHRCVACDPAQKDCEPGTACDPVTRKCRRPCGDAGAACFGEGAAPLCYSSGFCGCRAGSGSSMGSCSGLGDRRLCDPATGTCVECLEDGDCREDSARRCLDGVCVRCVKAADCPSGKCEPLTHQCLP